MADAVDFGVFTGVEESANVYIDKKDEVCYYESKLEHKIKNLTNNNKK